MRIALVSEHASPVAPLGGHDAGGQNVHVAALAAEFVRRGHEVVVHTRRDDPDLPSRLVLPPGVVVDHIDAGPPEPVAKDDLLPWMPEFGRALGRRWRASRPDVVHAHFWMSGLASLIGAVDLQLPVVQTFHALGSVKRQHQGTADTSPPGRVQIETRVARDVDLVIATADSEALELERLGVPPRRVRVVPCGVDLSLFSPEGETAPRNGRPRLLSVGRLVERKGVDIVIEALADVPGAELLVAGGLDGIDVDRARLRATAERVGVQDRVEFLGPVGRRDLPALIRSADAVVATPWYEPFGIVPLEAMACGVPVVGSAVGGLTESVLDGRTGMLVPPRDPRALATALRTLLSDDQVRRSMGVLGARRARDCYGWGSVADRTLAHYRTVVARRPVDVRHGPVASPLVTQAAR